MTDPRPFRTRSFASILASKLGLFAALMLLPTGWGHAEEPNAGKLRVFVLAGQSNMVGHANYITVPRLFADEREDVQALSSLVFRDGERVTRETVDELIAVRIQRDQLNRQLRNKEIEGDEAIAVAESELNELQEIVARKEAAIKETFAVSEDVYISSIADRNRGEGPLSIGFGASADKIGPELGFGMSMAQRLDGPILLIKTSWGGKSLHYNFRPPSAGAYELS